MKSDFCHGEAHFGFRTFVELEAKTDLTQGDILALKFYAMDVIYALRQRWQALLLLPFAAFLIQTQARAQEY